LNFASGWTGGQVPWLAPFCPAPYCLLHGAEAVDGCQRGVRDPAAMLRCFQEQFLCPIDDDAGLQQDCWHLGVREHDQVVVAIDPGVGVEKLAALASDVLQMMTGVGEALRLQLDPKQVAEREALGCLWICARDEQRMAREAVAVEAALACVRP